MENLGAELAEAEAEFAELTGEERLSDLNSRLEREEMELLQLKTLEEWEEERSGS